MKKKGKIKENRGKGLKNMRASREGYGSNYRFRISFLASLKSIREVRGASCLLRGRGGKIPENDEKTREWMGIIPLNLTNMVFR